MSKSPAPGGDLARTPAEPDPVEVGAPPPPSRRARIVHRLISFGALFQRPMTLGVRAAVFDPDNRVMLVRHGYIRGYYLPGGGVESGETLAEALARELIEECGVRLTGAATLRGVYLNRRASRRDHVALFVVRDFDYNGPPAPNLEIVEAAFFPVDALPQDTTPATRARIAEILTDGPAAPYW
jgi:8-oxo-dGTP pyrophosphatase MutT (NUDIX family)